ncbi:MAG: carbon-nitrogen hydrolase family protein [Lachnospiraceae bacterium]|nr:carbon-nitrogen hydrolase family protein [Lachnospiraceae bacterium]
MKIACIQMKVQKENDANLRAACGFVRQAARQGADFVILPEMFCCPYETANFPVYAQPEGGENWQTLSDCARENQVYLAAGSMPECSPPECEAGRHLRESSTGGRESADIASEYCTGNSSEYYADNPPEYHADNASEGMQKETLKEALKETLLVYNTSYIFNRQGEQIAKHRKMHLFDIDIRGGQRFFESETLTAGSQVTVFDTEFGRMGLMICFDIRFPELARLMALNGARAILVPAAFNMTTGPAHWELAFRSRAVDNQVFMVGCSPARDMESSYHAYGNSLVVSPWGDIRARLDERESILFCDIDLNETGTIREQLPLLRARRTDVYRLDESIKCMKGRDSCSGA